VGDLFLPWALSKHVVVLNLDSQMTQEPLNLSCFLIGDDKTFQVEINATKLVGNLINKTRTTEGLLVGVY